MNELTIENKPFDYTKIDSSVAEFLKLKESNMREAVGRAETKVGQELHEGRNALSKHGYGCFEEWYTSLGLKKTKVYQLIERFELIVHNTDKQNLLEELPLSLSYEVAKKTADPELKQQVLDGEINSLKQWHKEKQRMEMELKVAKGELTKVSEKLEEEMNKPNKTVTETIEVMPKDIKKKIEDLKFENHHLRSGYKEGQEKLKRYELLNTDEYDAEQSKKQLEKLQTEAEIETVNIRIAYKQFIEEVAITDYLHGAIASASAAEKKRLLELVEISEKIIQNTKAALMARKVSAVNE